eukprot:Skav203258  [mRNA]  locus=scaffold1000:193178:199121:+ [translate_table: standard]
MARDVPSSSASFDTEVPWNAGNFIATVYGVPPCPQEVLPSMVAGVCGPGADGCVPFDRPAAPLPVSDELHQRWRKSKKAKTRNRRRNEDPRDPSSDVQLHHLQQPRTPTRGPAKSTEEEKPVEPSKPSSDYVEVQVEEAPLKRRRARWDDEPEATPFKFALQFTPPSGVPDSTVQQMVRVVSHILREIRNHTFSALDFVIQIPNSDPALYSAITDFGVVLTRLAIHTRYSALSYGTRWALVYDSKTQEGHVLTVFLNFIVIPVRPAPLQASLARPPRDDNPSEGKRGRSPPRGPPSGGKTRKVFGGGRTTHAGKGHRRGFSCPPVVSDVSLQLLVPPHQSGPSATLDPLEPWPSVAPLPPQCLDDEAKDQHVQNAEALKDHHGPALLDVMQDADDLHEVYESWSATQAILDHFAAQNLPKDTHEANFGATSGADHVPAGQLSPSVPLSVDSQSFVAETKTGYLPNAVNQMVSPTLPWNFDLKPDPLEAPKDRHVSSKAVQVIEDLANFKDLLLTSLGGLCGTTVAFPDVQGRIQFMHSADCRAYMDACPRCLRTHCDCPIKAFRLPPLPSTQGTPEVQVLRQYQHSTENLFTHEGTFTIHFDLKRMVAHGLWEISFQGFSGLLLIPSHFDSFYIPAVGHQLALFQVPCVGTVYQDDVPWPIFQAPIPPHPGAMVRRPMPEAVPRILELFAGLGGWKQAIRSLRPDDLVVSIEIDANRAKYISSNYGIPVNSSDFVRFPPDEEAVVITDVRNSEWWAGTLDLPFTTIVYSAPCPPWSRGGTQAGFDSTEGLLLAHSIGLVHLFGVSTAAGENVDGLVDHPHWSRVSALLDSLDRPTQVKVHDLGTIGGMTRKRSFLLTGAPLQFKEWTSQQVNWNFIGSRMTDFEAKGNLALPLDTSTPLFLTKFLPFDKRMQAHSLNVVNGPAVVQLRCHRGPVLPTLVASYRFQDKLDLAHLLKKGIFTWLVADDDFPFGVRFLHAFEAVRCLGFQMDLRLPSDQSFAMQLLGNCVSPVQALWALMQLLPTTCDPYEVACGWLFHQLPLQSLRAVIFEDDMFLVQSIPLGRPHFLRADVQMISCDGALFPVPSPLAHSRTRVACTLPLAAPWSLLEVGRWLHEDSLLLIARVVPLQVMIGDVTVLLSPFAALDVLAPFLEAHTPSHLETNPLWTWFTNDMPVFHWPDQRLVVNPPRVFLTTGTHVKAVPWVEGQSIAQCVEQTFHFRPLHLALAISGDGVPLDTQAPVKPFQAIQCQFAPQQFFIEPHGAFTLDPMSRVSSVARMVSDLCFGGRASVRLTCNGKLLSPDLFIGYANSIGVSRARVFALPGGAPSLAAQMETLQTLLVQHGHPASTSKAKSDEIYNLLGQKKIRVITESKTPWIQLKAEASAANLVLIPPENRGQSSSSVDPLQVDDPWKNVAAQPQKSNKKKKAPQAPPTRVDLSFFHAAGQPVTQIEMPQLLQGVPGLVVTDLRSFRDHLGTALETNLTVGASGILLMGVDPHMVNIEQSTRVRALAVPGWLGSSPSSFRATLVQTGDEPMEVKALRELALPATRTTHCVVQFHVYRDEAESWDLLATQGVVAFLKHINFVHFGSITQTWSTEFFSGGKKVPSSQAAYYHGFLKVEVARLEPLLKLGGISGFYPSPRSDSRGPDPTYRNLLLRGLTLAEARAALAKTSAHFGLTRGKHGFGIRVRATDYPEVRKTHFPNGADSSDSDPGGPRKFQLLGVDESISRSLLKQALSTMGWSARVSRAAGYRAWSVFSSDDPPARSFPLRQATVMIVETSAASSNGPVLGSTSKHYRSAQVNLAPAPVLPIPSVSGAAAAKYDQLESQAAQRVTTLEKKFEALAETVAASQQATSKHVEDLSRSVAQTHQQMGDQSKKFETQLKTMFSKLADTQKAGFTALEKASHDALETSLQGLRKENADAIRAMRSEFEEGYKELKDILANSPKARKTDGAPPAAP